jgi:pYEATS domain-containing protein involved in immunity
MSSKLTIQQSEEYKGNDWWKWAVWLEGSKTALDQIEYVEWTLHPTFRNPIRKTSDRSRKFRIETGGWGMFPIHARVQAKDGSSVILRHNLRLHYPARKKTPDSQEELDIKRDSYQGKTRTAAKLSIGTGPVEKFAQWTKLIKSLLSNRAMTSQMATTTRSPDAGRVEAEQRNIQVHGFLYAARMDPSNDFTLIVGAKPSSDRGLYLIMVVSGLPPVSNKSFARLNEVRTAFKDFFGASLPGPSYDFYEPPIPIEVEGSLLFNPSPRSKGPKSLKTSIATNDWEVHPITKIVFPNAE